MNAASILDEFLNDSSTNPLSKHDSLLIQAYNLVKKELVKSNYSFEQVQLAHKIYGYMGDQGLNERVQLMREFLQNNLEASLENKFWANWELVDNLALLKRYREMIEEQKLFFEWTTNNMSDQYLIKVMFDSTQAIGWVQENQEDEWFEIYNQLIKKVEPTSQNRHDRILLVETATGLLIYNLHRYHAAKIELERYYDILNENTNWDQYNRFYIRLKSYQLGLYSGQDDWEKYDEIVEDAKVKIRSSASRISKEDKEAIDDVCDMAHELGTCLMWERRYEQAIPLFEYALENQGTGVTHFFYAICIWATRKDRNKTLHHLQSAESSIRGNGGLRSRYIHMFLEQPEFQEVWNDEEFLSVFNR